MTHYRDAGRLLAATALLGFGVLGFALPAAAAAGDSVTIDNASSLTIRAGQPLSVASIAKATCKIGLTSRTLVLSLTGPAGPSSTTQTVKADHAPCSRDASLVTSVASPKRNGSYVVTLTNGRSANTTSATLDVLIPPGRTGGLSATADGTIASFSWTANPEPDITSYQILNAAGSVVSSLTAAAACAGGSSCSSTLDLGPKAAGRTEKFAVRAVRCGLSCSGDDVTGARSASASVTFAADPTTPGPTHPGGGTGGTHGNGGTGSTTQGNGGTTGGGRAGSAGQGHVGGHRASGNGFTLPTLSAAGLAHLRTKPLRSVGEPTAAAPKIATSTPARRTTSAATHHVSSGLQLPPLWRGIAAAAVLVLIAMHLRAWAARVDLV